MVDQWSFLSEDVRGRSYGHRRPTARQQQRTAEDILEDVRQRAVDDYARRVSDLQRSLADIGQTRHIQSIVSTLDPLSTAAKFLREMMPESVDANEPGVADASAPAANAGTARKRVDGVLPQLPQPGAHGMRAATAPLGASRGTRPADAAVGTDAVEHERERDIIWRQAHQVRLATTVPDELLTRGSGVPVAVPHYLKSVPKVGERLLEQHEEAAGPLAAP